MWIDDGSGHERVYRNPGDKEARFIEIIFPRWRVDSENGIQDAAPVDWLFAFLFLFAYFTTRPDRAA